MYLKCFPSAGMWTPGVAETSAIGIAGVNWDLMRIEAGWEKKKNYLSPPPTSYWVGFCIIFAEARRNS